MESTDRVGIVQTNNSKGENCGLIVKLDDLDKEVKNKLIVYDKLDKFIREQKDIPPEFEKVFQEHWKELLA